jgi:hypothetical protein
MARFRFGGSRHASGFDNGAGVSYTRYSTPLAARRGEPIELRIARSRPRFAAIRRGRRRRCPGQLGLIPNLWLLMLSLFSSTNNKTKFSGFFFFWGFWSLPPRVPGSHVHQDPLHLASPLFSSLVASHSGGSRRVSQRDQQEELRARCGLRTGPALVVAQQPPRPLWRGSPCY